MAPTPSVLHYRRRLSADVCLVSLLLNQQVHVQLLPNTVVWFGYSAALETFVVPMKSEAALLLLTAPTVGSGAVRALSAPSRLQRRLCHGRTSTVIAARRQT